MSKAGLERSSSSQRICMVCRVYQISSVLYGSWRLLGAEGVAEGKEISSSSWPTFYLRGNSLDIVS